MDGRSDGASAVLLKGGRGGKGNAHFATSRQQAPRFAQPGEPGQELDLTIELRLIADVGLVGKPNAGKSSLLGRLTAATPKVGAYPFTTKIPNLGVLTLSDSQRVIADIPGIIEGASQGAGLGLSFLRHISRTRILAFILDLTDDPVGAFQQLLDELESYSHELAVRPRIVVGNKIDLSDARDGLERFHEALPDEALLAVSALTGEGIRELAGALVRDTEVHHGDLLRTDAGEGEETG
jgi:GTP-binding protein